MESIDKDLRDRRIMDLNNSGKSIAQIAEEVGMSKGGVHKVLSKFLIKGEVVSKKEEVVELEITGEEEKVSTLVGWKRLDVNEYVNEKTGEIMRIKWVKAKSSTEFGYFVKVGSLGNVNDIEVVSEEEVRHNERLAESSFRDFMNDKD
jgi:transposase